MISTIGTLIAKIQRHEALSTSCPPISGPSTVPMPLHAVHAPIARPRSSGGKVAAITASAAGVSTAPHTPWSARETTSSSIVGASGAEHRRDPEADHTELEHAARSEQVAERAAHQDQRCERDEVGVRRPLLAGEPTAEVLVNGRKGDVHDGRVDRHHRRAEDRGYEC